MPENMHFIVQMGQPEQDEQAVHRSADAKICQKTCIFSCKWVQPIKMSKQSAEALLPGCARKHAFLSGGLVFVHIMLLRDQSKGLSSRGHFFSHYGAPAPSARTFPHRCIGHCIKQTNPEKEGALEGLLARLALLNVSSWLS